jgi:hypothetical protein
VSCGGSPISPKRRAAGLPGGDRFPDRQLGKKLRIANNRIRDANSLDERIFTLEIAFSKQNYPVESPRRMNDRITV